MVAWLMEKLGDAVDAAALWTLSAPYLTARTLSAPPLEPLGSAVTHTMVEKKVTVMVDCTVENKRLESICRKANAYPKIAQKKREATPFYRR